MGQDVLTSLGNLLLKKEGLKTEAILLFSNEVFQPNQEKNNQDKR